MQRLTGLRLRIEQLSELYEQRLLAESGLTVNLEIPHIVLEMELRDDD